MNLIDEIMKTAGVVMKQIKIVKEEHDALKECTKLLSAMTDKELSILIERSIVLLNYRKGLKILRRRLHD